MSVTKSQKWQQIQNKISASGKMVGRKAANLEELVELKKSLEKRQILQNVEVDKEKPNKGSASKKQDLGTSIQVEIPPFFPIEDSPVREHLYRFAPRIKELWDSFIKTQTGHLSLTEPSIKTLQEIQEIIRTVFTEHAFQNELMKQFLVGLDKEDLLMVRSTGMEDSVDFANPGGNESVAGVEPNEKAVSEAMGIVVASYFSEKSIGQRLQGKQEVITESTFMPVLVQKMIGEKLGGERDPKPENIVKSGVIHVTPAGVRIDVSSGHGELVVNSLGPSDSYYVNVNMSGVVHEQRLVKTHRLVPMESTELDPKTQIVRKKIKLKTIQNPPKLAQAPSLTDTEARLLAKKAEEIQQHYELPMDLEFVFDPKKKIFYLVQARPIQQELGFSEKLNIIEAKPKTELTIKAEQKEQMERKEESEKRSDPRLDMPSSVPPEKMKELTELQQKHQVAILEGRVITAAKAALKVVTHPDQLIIADTIGEALAEFSDPKKPYKDRAVAVIIRERALKTSHEAAYLNSCGIPVLQMPMKETIETWLQDPSFVLMIDPQRNQVVNWTRQIKEVNQAEKELRDRGFIKEGFFKSPDRFYEKAIPYGFQKLKAVAGIRQRKITQPKESKVKHEEIAQDTVQTDTLRTDQLGELIHRAQNSDPDIAVDAFKALLAQLYPLIEGLDVSQIKREKGKIAELVKSSIIRIEAATPGNTKNAQEALGYLVMLFAKFAKIKGLKEDSPHYALFRSALITCAEIHRILIKVETMDQTSKEWKNAQEELLRLVASIESFLHSPKEMDSISDSIKQILEEEQAIKRALTLAGEVKLNQEQLEYFVEFMKYQKLALNPDAAKEWTEFALEACQNPLNRQLLSFMVKFSTTHFIESDWINEVFKRHMMHTKKDLSRPHITSVLFEAMKQRKQEKKQLKESQEIKAKKEPLTGSLPTLERLAIAEEEPKEKRKMKMIFRGMLREGTQTAHELETLDFAKVQLVLNTWGNPMKIKAWADPNNFDALYQGFVKEVVPLIEQLKLKPDLQPLTKKIILKTVQQLTEIIDKSIKSLKGSPDYGRYIELQVNRFTLLLEHYQKLMEIWVLQVPKNVRALHRKWTQHYSENDIGVVVSSIKRSFGRLKTQNDSKQLQPSGKFSVASARIDSSADFDRQFRRIVDQLTKEDLFTLFHQNLMASTGILLSQQQIQTEDLPPIIQPLISSLKQKLELLWVEHAYPKLIFEFNKPLRNHSAKFIVEYDESTKQIKIHHQFFGHNERNRMDIIAAFANMEAEFLGIHQPKKAKFNEKAYSVEYTYQFDISKLPFLKDHLVSSIQDFCDITMDTSLQSESEVQRPWLKSLLKKHPGFEMDMFYKLNKYPAILQDLVFNFFPKLIQDPKTFTEKMFIECLGVFNQKFGQKILEQNAINPKHKVLLKTLSTKYPPDKKWGTSEYTMFHLLVCSLDEKELKEYMQSHQIDCAKYPQVLNLALARARATEPADLSVFELLKQNGAKFEEFSHQVLQEPFETNPYFKSPQIRDIIVNEFLENPKKQRLSLRMNLINGLLLHLEPKFIEATINALLDKGANYDEFNPKVLLHIVHYPTLLKRYKERVRTPSWLYDDEVSKADLLIECLKYNDLSDFSIYLIQSGYYLVEKSFTSPSIDLDIFSDKALSEPLIRKFWFDFVTSQANSNDKFKNHIVDMSFKSSNGDDLKPGRMEMYADYFDYALQKNLLSKKHFLDKVINEIKVLALSPQEKTEAFIKKFKTIQHHPLMQKELSQSLDHLYESCVNNANPQNHACINFMKQVLGYQESKKETHKPKT